MNKTQIKKEIKEIVTQVQIIQEQSISPLEDKVTMLLMELYPKATQANAQDWMLDVLYNNPKGALKVMDKVYGG